MTNLLMRLFGLGKAIDALDGETSKTYQGGAGLILTGLASVIGGLAGVVGQIAAAHGGSEYLALAKDIPHNASVGLITLGYGSIKAGIAVIGQRHALAKAEAKAAAPSVETTKP